MIQTADEPFDVFDVWSYNEVDQVLRDNETFSSGAIRELMELVMGPYVLVGMDEPEHKRHRSLVSQAPSARRPARVGDRLRRVGREPAHRPLRRPRRRRAGTRVHVPLPGAW